MKFECYSDWELLPVSADALFAQAEQDSFFFSRAWFEQAATALDDDETMLLACVVVDSTVLAVLPLVQTVGSTWYALKHPYTTHYSFLLAVDSRDEILTCLTHGLSQLPLRAMQLDPVANDDPKINRLQEKLVTAGFACEQVFRIYNWVHRLNGQSFKEYMADRPSWLRNTIDRKQRKLAREHGYEIRLYTGDDVPYAMPDYYAPYTASWKANEQQVDFVDAIVARFSARGWSRLAVLSVSGQPIAAQLWFVLHGKANIFRLAYDQDWQAYSPGSILTRYLMEVVIDTDKVEEIDFLTGDEAYKSSWMSDRRERYALSAIKKESPSTRRTQWLASVKKILKRH